MFVDLVLSSEGDVSQLNLDWVMIVTDSKQVVKLDDGTVCFALYIKLKDAGYHAYFKTEKDKEKFKRTVRKYKNGNRRISSDE